MERDNKLDFIKLISCFGVVLLHTINKDFGEINLFIYYFGTISIPLFFMVDGALLLNKKSISYKYSIKKLTRVLTVAFGWALIGFFFHAILSKDVSFWYLDIFAWPLQKGYSGILWFIASLAIIYLFLPMFYKISNNEKTNIIFICLLSLLCIIAFVLNIFFSKKYGVIFESLIPQTLRVWEHWMYFFLGGFLYRNKRELNCKPIYIIFLSILVFIFIVLVSYFSSKYLFVNNYAEFDYTHPLVIAGISLLYYLIINAKINVPIFTFFVQPTMGIYLNHLYFFTVLNKLIFANFNISSIYLLAPAIVFLISWFANSIVLKIKYINYLIKL